MPKKKYEIIDPRKCPTHRMWKKKGQCELCLVERDKRLKQYEKEGGSNKPPVVIKTI